MRKIKRISAIVFSLLVISLLSSSMLWAQAQEKAVKSPQAVWDYGLYKCPGTIDDYTCEYIYKPDVGCDPSDPWNPCP